MSDPSMSGVTVTIVFAQIIHY